MWNDYKVCSRFTLTTVIFFVNDRYDDRDQLDVNRRGGRGYGMVTDEMHAMVNRRVRPPEQCVVVNHHDWLDDY